MISTKTLMSSFRFAGNVTVDSLIPYYANVFYKFELNSKLRILKS